MEGTKAINRSLSVLTNDNSVKGQSSKNSNQVSSTFFSAAQTFSNKFGEFMFALKAIFSGQGIDIAKQSRNLKNQQIVAKTAELLNNAISGKSFDDIDAVELGSIIDRDNKSFTLKLEKNDGKINIVSISTDGTKEIVNSDQPITKHNFNNIKNNVSQICHHIEEQKQGIINRLNQLNQEISTSINSMFKFNAEMYIGGAYNNVKDDIKDKIQDKYGKFFTHQENANLLNHNDLKEKVLSEFESLSGQINNTHNIQCEIGALDIGNKNFTITFVGTDGSMNVAYSPPITWSATWLLDQEEQLLPPSPTLTEYDEEQV